MVIKCGLLPIPSSFCSACVVGFDMKLRSSAFSHSFTPFFIEYADSGLPLSTIYQPIEGHTTMTCPHRVATEFGVIPASHKNTRNALLYVFERQFKPHIPPVSHFLLLLVIFILIFYLLFMEIISLF